MKIVERYPPGSPMPDYLRREYERFEALLEAYPPPEFPRREIERLDALFGPRPPQIDRQPPRAFLQALEPVERPAPTINLNLTIVLT